MQIGIEQEVGSTEQVQKLICIADFELRKFGSVYNAVDNPQITQMLEIDSA